MILIDTKIIYLFEQFVDDNSNLSLIHTCKKFYNNRDIISIKRFIDLDIWLKSKKDKRIKKVKIDDFDKASQTDIFVSKNIIMINLYDNVIGFEGVKIMADALKVNTSIQSLYLYSNILIFEVATRLFDAFRINNSIQHLNLHNNQIGLEGSKSLADAIRVNKSIQSLNLGYNQIEAKEIG